MTTDTENVSYTQGIELLENAQYKEAERFFLECMQSQKRDFTRNQAAEIHLHLARTYAKMKRYDEAMQCIQLGRKFYELQEMAVLQKQIEEQIKIDKLMQESLDVLIPPLPEINPNRKKEEIESEE